jgi:hypothetical protein
MVYRNPSLHEVLLGQQRYNIIENKALLGHNLLAESLKNV